MSDFLVEYRIMKNLNKYFLILFLAAFFTSPFFCSAQEKIFYMSQLKEKEGIKSLTKNADKIDILAPQFFAVTAKMKIAGQRAWRLLDDSGKIQGRAIIAHEHCLSWFVVRSIIRIGRAALIRIGAPVPPIDSLEPRFVPERFKDRPIAVRLCLKVSA